MSVNLPQALAAAKQNLRNTVHRGIVVSNTDPTFQQRIIVRVRDIHSGLMDADLPFCGKAHRAQYLAGNVGEVDVPPVGSVVNVTFLDDTLYHSQYDFAPGGSDVGVEKIFPDYPDSRGRQDFAGFKVWFNQKAGSESFNFQAIDGTTITLTVGGLLSVHAAHNLLVQANGDIDIAAGGNMALSAQGNVAIGAGGSFTAGGSNATLTSGSSDVTLGGSCTINGSSFSVNANDIGLNAGNIGLNAGSVSSGSDIASPTGASGSAGSAAAVPGRMTVPAANTYARPNIQFTANQTDY